MTINLDEYTYENECALVTLGHTMLMDDDSALDSSLFVFSEAAMTVEVYNTDQTNLGDYTLKLIGTLSGSIPE